MEGGDTLLVLTGTVVVDGVTTDVIRLTINTLTGEFEVLLLKGIDHPDAGEVGADDPLDLAFVYTVSDGEGNTDTSTLTIQIQDAGPVDGNPDPHPGSGWCHDGCPSPGDQYPDRRVRGPAAQGDRPSGFR